MLRWDLVTTTVLCYCLAGTPARAADVPSLVGAWAPVDDFVASGKGRNQVPTWPEHTGKDGVWTPTPAVVVERQDGRLVSGYIVTPKGQHDPFHGIVKHNGTALVGRNAAGIITADLDGDRMEWCWVSTSPGTDYVACNALQRQASGK